MPYAPKVLIQPMTYPPRSNRRNIPDSYDPSILAVLCTQWRTNHLSVTPIIHSYGEKDIDSLDSPSGVTGSVSSRREHDRWMP